jgi:uncharacterized protein YndB with AHSA1/START domain
MEFTSEVIINKPIAKVAELATDVKSIQKWQPQVASYETISGTPGEVGAKSNMVVNPGGRTIQMVETIVSKNLPHEYVATYEAPGVYNLVKNTFTEIDANTTKYTSYNEFKFTTLMMKVLGFVMGGSFKKSSDETLMNFKKFAESQS